MTVFGSTNLYGYTIGILVNEASFPRLPGAIGNATTFPFPVLQLPVAGATGQRVVREAATLNESVLAPYIKGAQELEAAGAKAITTSCGFMAMFQSELAAAVSVPVFASSLLLVPLIARMLRAGEKVGIVTADSRHITDRHYAGAGIDATRVALSGLEGSPEFEAVVFHDKHEMNVERFEAEVLAAATRLVAENRSVRALLLECSLLPPFAAAVQRAIRLPVFDFTSLVMMVHGALVRKPFEGYL
jgi:Asp/Glu/hydantoin racemase